MSERLTIEDLRAWRCVSGSLPRALAVRIDHGVFGAIVDELIAYREADAKQGDVELSDDRLLEAALPNLQGNFVTDRKLRDVLIKLKLMGFFREARK